MNNTKQIDHPIPGKQYALTGGTGEKCIANGNTWEESAVQPVDNLTINHLGQYYIDVLGYSREDIELKTRPEMIQDLSDAQLSDCLAFNNIK